MTHFLISTHAQLAQDDVRETTSALRLFFLEVAELARRLWLEGGEQWLQENRMNDQRPQTVLVSRWLSWLDGYGQRGASSGSVRTE
jgi:hypothetical protein